MPIEQCKENKLYGYKYGSRGKCYTYNDEKTKEIAYHNAVKQMKARFASRRFCKIIETFNLFYKKRNSM